MSCALGASSIGLAKSEMADGGVGGGITQVRPSGTYWGSHKHSAWPPVTAQRPCPEQLTPAQGSGVASGPQRSRRSGPPCRQAQRRFPSPRELRRRQRRSPSQPRRRCPVGEAGVGWLRVGVARRRGRVSLLAPASSGECAALLHTRRRGLPSTSRGTCGPTWRDRKASPMPTTEE